MITLCREKGFKFSDGDPGEYKVEYDLLQEEGITDGTLAAKKLMIPMTQQVGKQQKKS
jgi:hypothetical protein